MALPLSQLSPQAYLELERVAEFKSEYYRGGTFAMAGGTLLHSRLTMRLAYLIRVRLDGKDCEVYNSDARVCTQVNGGLYTYPDLTIVCGKPIALDDSLDVLMNPKVIVEVLSPSTEAKDRGFKFQQYKQVATLEEYILVSQTEPLVERFSRSANKTWTNYEDVRGLDGILRLNALGVEIPLAELFTDAEFQPQ